jgi:hypothetical protein
MNIKSIVSTAAVALALTAGGLHGQTIAAYGVANADNQGNGPDGDIILGFTNPTSPPSYAGTPSDLVFDIGPANNFYSTAFGGTLTAGTTYTVEGFTPSDVTSLFGGGAFTNNSILWGIVGGNGTAGGPAGNSAPNYTVWAATPGAALQASSAQANASSNIDSLTNPLSFYPASASGNAAFVPEASGFYNTATNGGSAAAGTFGYFSSSILGTLSTGGGTMALYELIQPGSGSVTGVELGVFTLSASGLTFTAIPEPSMYAAILGVLTLGFVMIRRRMNSAKLSAIG